MNGKRVMNNFSAEEEKLIRHFLFTNPQGDTSLVYPQSLVAGEELSPLMSAVSRTHASMQERVLQFLDTEKTEQTRAFLPMIRPMMDIFRLPDGTLNISRRTMDFNKEWVIAHGHGSIKEGTNVFGHAEDISDITGKKITGHPLNHPQVKSTRYISYKRVLPLSLEDPDIRALPDADFFLAHINYMNRRYLEVTERLTEAVFGHSYTAQVAAFLKGPAVVEMEVEKKIERQRLFDAEYSARDADRERFRQEVLKGLEDDAVRRDVGKFILDYSRSYLLAVTKTSLVFSVDARTLEEIITEMISTPRKEDQNRGDALWAEAKKIAPVLLGEKSHVKVDPWRLQNETEFRRYVEEKFGKIPGRTTITNDSKTRMVNLLHPQNIAQYTDRFNAALVVFPYVDAALQDIHDHVRDTDVSDILLHAHKFRSKHDVLNPAIAHGGLMQEIVMAYHGYRDLFRHRRGSRSVQLLTTRLGFETPEIFKIFGLDKEYESDMRRCAEVYEKARAVSPHAAEKLVPFGALCRSLHSWQVNQVGYIGKLRSDIAKGNLTYVYVARELMKAVAEIMPETAKYFRYDTRDYPAELWKRGYSWFDSTQQKE